MKRTFHQKTAFEMAVELQTLLNAQPIVAFEDLQAGSDYHYKPSYGTGEQILTVKRMLPSRRMVDVVDYGQSNIRRITPTRYHGTFRLLNDELRTWIGITHEDIVSKAMADGLDIPARVRIYYPEKFVTIPERFSIEKLRDLLHPQWRRVVTEATVIEMIEQRHQSIRKLDEQIPKVAALNPGLIQDYERYITDHKADIDFYRWLQPHLSVNGVFHVEQEGAQK